MSEIPLYLYPQPIIVHIYALAHPLKWRIYYVGASRRCPFIRALEHIEDARHGGKTRRALWLRALLAADAFPRVFVLESLSVPCTRTPDGPFHTNGADIAAERWWIDFLRDIHGHPLKNSGRPSGIGATCLGDVPNSHPTPKLPHKLTALIQGTRRRINSGEKSETSRPESKGEPRNQA